MRRFQIRSVNWTLAVLFATLLAPRGAGASTPVAFGDILSQPGQYHLEGDLSGSGDAVTITASNVRLHLRGHSLTGDGAPGQIGILVVGTPTEPSGGCDAVVHNVHVNGGIVSGFSGSGIQMQCVVDSHVNGMTANDNHHGLTLLSSSRNKINGNDFSGNETRGLFIVSSSSNRFVNNDLSLNGNTGTSVFNSSDNQFIGNIMNGNGFFGMFLDGSPGPGGGSFHNTVRDNIFNGNGVQPGVCPFFGGGLLIGTVPGPLAVDNVAQSNTAHFNACGWDLADLNLLNAFGGMCLNTWKSNDFGAILNFGGAFGVGDPNCIK